MRILIFFMKNLNKFYNKNNCIKNKIFKSKENYNKKKGILFLLFLLLSQIDLLINLYILFRINYELFHILNIQNETFYSLNIINP